MARKEKKRYQQALAFDAYLTFAILAGVGLATWTLDQLLRMTLLWLTLLALTAVYAAGKRVEVTYSYFEIGRGALAGLFISLPLVLLARDFFLATSQRLLPIDNTLALFWGLVFVMPALEALYFRGLLQREKGLWAAVLLFAVVFEALFAVLLETVFFLVLLSADFAAFPCEGFFEVFAISAT